LSIDDDADVLRRRATQVQRPVARTSLKSDVLYHLPATGRRSPGIACRQSAINDSLAPKPSPNPISTLAKTLALALTLAIN